MIPRKVGLYDPQFDKDSCGVSIVANLNGVADHETVQNGCRALRNLRHRAAEIQEEGIPVGDGAGILVALPNAFFREKLGSHLQLREALSHYGVGMLFLPALDPLYDVAKDSIKLACDRVGLRILAWRTVPINSSLPLAPSTRRLMPRIEQVFVESLTATDQDALESQLYVARKISELRFRTQQDTTSDSSPAEAWNALYVCSFSSKTIVYKGMLTPDQLSGFFLDLQDPLFQSHFAMVHCRFSTNTFPSWHRAQPCRMICHNGEINTLRGNMNAMRAREGNATGKVADVDISELFPIIEPFGSDSMALDNTVEFLVRASSRSLPESMLTLVPEAWQRNNSMEENRKAFYAFNANSMEPWDGPALLCFSDSQHVGAILDRNGLRPARFVVTKDGRVVFGSEVGVLPDVTRDNNVVRKGRLKPGKMFLIDFAKGMLIKDRETKLALASRYPYASWLKESQIYLSDIPTLGGIPDDLVTKINCRLLMPIFNWSYETLTQVLTPMVQDGFDALGSMGNDEALACLITDRPVLIYNYFKQLFAQVTNPPIDPIREGIVMSLDSQVGPEGDLCRAYDPSNSGRLVLKTPILKIDELARIKSLGDAGYKVKNTPLRVLTVDCTYDIKESLQDALHRIQNEVIRAVESSDPLQRAQILILSDRQVSSERLPVSSLLACGAVHHSLIDFRLRKRVGIIVETAEARELHHMCCLLGFGADAVCPYLAFEIITFLAENEKEIAYDTGIANYIKALSDGILKVVSKMGISTLESYKGAQIFEAVGLSTEITSCCFSGVASRLGGVNFAKLDRDARYLHSTSFDSSCVVQSLEKMNGSIHWRPAGPQHLHTPEAIIKIQQAAKTNSRATFASFTTLANAEAEKCVLRGLLSPITARERGETEIPLDQVESAQEIVKRFVTGAMSYGSISRETHEALAIAMNRLGARSNTGEGGEHAFRWSDPSLNSAIKQVASARFGVNIEYLSNCTMLQIKMAQGAKPGEGGELPGPKVEAEIAAVRHATPGVGLISPPPHHDIYSIEDLAQLIYDLKMANPVASISVKLVSEVGVGVIAAGVAKARADHILISGHEGGTGAARWTSIKHTGLPWELGLSEAHQTLVTNGLRDRVVLQTDGGLRTGKDVIYAALLGADEFGFGTLPLIALGCIMMRKCHLNTCPVGIATQDPELRRKFEGLPEHVINFFFLLAEDVRGILAEMGFKKIEDIVGRSELLRVNESNPAIRQNNLDVSELLVNPKRDPSVSNVSYTTKIRSAKERMSRFASPVEERTLDHDILDAIQKSDFFESKSRLQFELPIHNSDRTVGGLVSHHIAKRLRLSSSAPQAPTLETALHKRLQVKLTGTAGQSFGAWLCNDIKLEMKGESNDYVGKGLSGGTIVIYPPLKSVKIRSQTSKNVIIGNVALYGATSGFAFFAGRAAERFAVRNSGAVAVVEGCGDHGCEYMTGGCVVILGSVGRNFAAGMSGGIGFVWNRSGKLYQRCNASMVSLETIDIASEDADRLRNLIATHAEATGSEIGQFVLSQFPTVLNQFVKVIPNDYKRVLETQRVSASASSSSSSLVLSQKPASPEVAAPLDASDVEIYSFDIEDLVPSTKKEKISGFMKFKRRQPKRHADAGERANDFAPIYHPKNASEVHIHSKALHSKSAEDELKRQTARCMDCGVPYCMSSSGCPIHNLIPEFNDLVYRNSWRQALERLLKTNNFPEFTGLVCPAPCEGACTMNLVDKGKSVTIKSVENAIIERGWEEGWIVPQPPPSRTGKRVAIIGSGPSGLAAADQLNKLGHFVTIYERDDRAGGLLMYGIPEMKMEKKIVERRVSLMCDEGVRIITSVNVGVDISLEEIQRENDAVLLAVGAKWPNDVAIPGRESAGIHYAMDLLHPVTKYLLEKGDFSHLRVNPRNKRVVVLGGGDTAADCVATSLRLGCTSVICLEIMPQPPETRNASANPWPEWPRIYRVEYAHEEARAKQGTDPRQFNVMTKEFVADAQGKVCGLRIAQCEWRNSRPEAIAGTDLVIDCDLVLIAIGFRGAEKYVADHVGVGMNRFTFGASPESQYMTSQLGLFAAGDCRRGQSLVVWASQEGRKAAEAIHAFCENETPSEAKKETHVKTA